MPHGEVKARVRQVKAEGVLPITGAPKYLTIALENGFIWKVAQAAKTKVMGVSSGA